MQQIDPVRALQTARSAGSTPSPQPATSMTSRRTLARVWATGIGAWGHRWTSALGDLPVNDDGSITASAALWARHLAGLEERDVLAAIDHFAGRSDWPPALAEIRKRAFGIPSLEEVKADIGRRATGFGRMVWNNLDAWAFTRADQREAERMLRNAYDYAVERRMCGDEFPPEPAGELEHQRQEPPPAPTPEEREATLARVRAELGAEA